MTTATRSIGFHDGWRGVLEDRCEPSTSTLPRHPARGGTILGTVRYQPYRPTTASTGRALPSTTTGIDAIVAIGGEGTLGVRQGPRTRDGVPVVGVPKTIDNDIAGTEMTFGFQTAVQICTDAIDRLHTTAESHDRVMVVEVMGRHAGHIAVWAGIAGGATMTLDPRGALRHRRGVRAARCTATRPAGSPPSWWWPKGAVPKPGTLEIPRTRGRRVRPPAPRRHRHHRRRRDRTPHRVSRPGSRSSATSSGAAPRWPSTGSWPPGSASPPSTPSTTAPSATWSASREGKIGRISLEEAKARGLKTVDPQLYDVAQVFFAV